VTTTHLDRRQKVDARGDPSARGVVRESSQDRTALCAQNVPDRCGRRSAWQGILLGHRSSESTCVYLRLATDDLREVALSLPCWCVRSVDAGEGVMRAPRAFMSMLAPDIVRYLTVTQALGREYDGVRRVLAHVDQFLTSRGDDLTPDTFAGWCLTLQHLASGTRRHRMRVVRNFCVYRGRGVPAAFVPDERLFPPEHQVIRPPSLHGGGGASPS
jgi:hypothetical protein